MPKCDASHNIKLSIAIKLLLQLYMILTAFVIKTKYFWRFQSRSSSYSEGKLLRINAFWIALNGASLIYTYGYKWIEIYEKFIVEIRVKVQ